MLWWSTWWSFKSIQSYFKFTQPGSVLHYIIYLVILTLSWLFKSLLCFHYLLQLWMTTKHKLFACMSVIFLRFSFRVRLSASCPCNECLHLRIWQNSLFCSLSLYVIHFSFHFRFRQVVLNVWWFYSSFSFTFTFYSVFNATIPTFTFSFFLCLLCVLFTLGANRSGFFLLQISNWPEVAYL